MSNIHNEIILENLMDEVNEMSDMAIVNELNIVPIADSWDEFFAFTDMEVLKERLVNQKFEAQGDII